MKPETRIQHVGSNDTFARLPGEAAQVPQIHIHIHIGEAASASDLNALGNLLRQYNHLTGPKAAQVVTTKKLHNRLRTIIEHVAAEFDLDPDVITRKTTRRRTERIAWPRQVACFFCRWFSDASLEEIGAQFTNYDHGSVLHGINAVENRIETDSVWRDCLKRIADDLRTILRVADSPDPISAMTLASEARNHRFRIRALNAAPKQTKLLLAAAA